MKMCGGLPKKEVRPGVIVGADTCFTCRGACQLRTEGAALLCWANPALVVEVTGNSVKVCTFALCFCLTYVSPSSVLCAALWGSDCRLLPCTPVTTGCSHVALDCCHHVGHEGHGETARTTEGGAEEWV